MQLAGEALVAVGRDQRQRQHVLGVLDHRPQLAVEAARVLLTQQMAEKGDALVTQAIKDVGDRLN